MDRSNQGLPTALVVGPQRAGTTWIHNYLLQRGDICLPRGVKETFFFDERYHKGCGWYTHHFRRKPHHSAVVEVGPTYFHSAAAAARIRDTLPGARVICVLRDPAERAFSLWLHLRRYGQTTVGFREAFLTVPILRDSSRYATSLRLWTDQNGGGRVTTLFMSLLKTDRDNYCRRLCEGIGVPFSKPASEFDQRVNAASRPRVQWLANTAQWAANRLRDRRCYGIINAAKKLGAKGLIMGSPALLKDTTLKHADRLWVYDRLASEIDELRELLHDPKEMSEWGPHRADQTDADRAA
ncbi:MAG: sulfotransferase [Bacteroidota bacterium]